MQSARSGSGADHPDSRPTLKVAAVARRLGVAPATLRTWARRYGLGPPAHTAGAHRQYTTDDLTRLLVMRRLTLEGVAPSEAARIALSTPVEGESGGGEPPPERLSAPSVLRRLTPRHAGPLRAAPPPEEGGDVRPLGPVDLYGDLVDQPVEVRRLLFAARDLDLAECTEHLGQLVAAQGVVRAWEHVAAPALRMVGAYWKASGDGCAVEHVLSEAVSAALHRAGSTPAEPMPGTALLACPEDDAHALPLLALASALAERRVRSLLLGARVPADALLSAVHRTRPRVVVLYAARAVPVADLPFLVELETSTRLVVGGPGWSGLAAPDGAVHAPSLAAAVDQVRLAVRH